MFNYIPNNIHDKITAFWLVKKNAILMKYSAEKMKYSAEKMEYSTENENSAIFVILTLTCCLDF